MGGWLELSSGEADNAAADYLTAAENGSGPPPTRGWVGQGHSAAALPRHCGVLPRGPPGAFSFSRKRSPRLREPRGPPSCPRTPRRPRLPAGRGPARPRGGAARRRPTRADGLPSATGAGHRHRGAPGFVVAGRRHNPNYSPGLWAAVVRGCERCWVVVRASGFGRVYGVFRGLMGRV